MRDQIGLKFRIETNSNFNLIKTYLTQDYLYPKFYIWFWYWFIYGFDTVVYYNVVFLCLLMLSKVLCVCVYSMTELQFTGTSRHQNQLLRLGETLLHRIMLFLSYRNLLVASSWAWNHLMLCGSKSGVVLSIIVPGIIRPWSSICSTGIEWH